MVQHGFQVGKASLMATSVTQSKYYGHCGWRQHSVVERACVLFSVAPTLLDHRIYSISEVGKVTWDNVSKVQRKQSMEKGFVNRQVLYTW